MPTPHTFTDLDVINMALTGRMGEDRITNLATDESTAAIVMREHYQQVKESTLTKTAWRFATVKKALNKLSGDPLNRWSAAWQLPPDLLKLLTTWPPTNYERQGNKIFTDVTSGLEIDYIRYVLEDQWPAWFRDYVVGRLVIATRRGITGEKPDSEDYEYLEAARADAFWQDAQQQPNPTNLPNPFIDARF